MKKLTAFFYSEDTHTIRSYPENYWIASVVNNELLFNSWDEAIVGRYDEKEIIKLWEQCKITTVKK